MDVRSLIGRDVPLAPWTTLQIGGPARCFLNASDAATAIAALELAAEEGVPVFLLGGGSNVLVADEGVPGLVLRVGLLGMEFCPAGASVLVRAGAGEEWDHLVAETVARGLAGLECLSGIPGLVGGTPVQNVGAYGQEVCETLVAVTAYDRQLRQTVRLENADCRFGHRSSLFNTEARHRYLILDVTFRLLPDGGPALRYPDVQSAFAGRSEPATLADVREAVRQIRKRKGMLLDPEDPDSRSAGSFFKNPLLAPSDFLKLQESVSRRPLLSEQQPLPHYPQENGCVKVPAAWLIERAGFRRGETYGRVGLSTKHILAIVNRGGGTAHEVRAFARVIRERVQQLFAISLLPEPVPMGLDLFGAEDDAHPDGET